MSEPEVKKIKELVILSGKGGCGKTSICASFAALAQNAVFADCDVDAADLMLVLQPEKISSEDFYSGELPEIDYDKCINCGKCEDLCRFDALKKNKDNCYNVSEVSCEGCGVCVDHCPVGAMKMVPRLCGDWSTAQTPYGKLVHARLGPGGENSGKLVIKVRDEAQKVAAAEKAEKIIVDGPPGIGCPVIASLGGAGHCLVVTEPTKSGLHDLERLLKLTKHFDIPASVCINKADINFQISEEIKNYCLESDAQFIGEIPYDPAVTTAQRKGLPVVALQAEASNAIREIWKKLQ